MKNLLFSIAALLFTVSSIAQLYVKPNGSDESYVYVQDQILYVTGDIDLTENPAGPEEASIYFRDGGQLIQGNDVANAGTGYISIHQNNPDSDAWDYAYWSSPIGDQTIAGTDNKNFGAMRFFNPQGTKDVGCDCYLGTDSKVNEPTANFNGEFNPEMKISRRWLYTYTNNVWSRFNDASNVIPGRGFTMKGLGTTNHDQTYDFRGRPNNGNIDTPILAAAALPNLNLSLSGNPYPSALDLNTVFWDPDNTEIFQFNYWDEDHNVNSHLYLDNKGGYGYWVPGVADPGGTIPGLYTVAPFLNYNNDGSTGTGTGVDGLSYERRFAPVGQGFMLYGVSDGDITYKNSHRVYVQENSGMSDFRSNDGDPVVNDETDSAIDVISTLPPDNRISHLRLNTYFNETHMRQLVLAFSNEATDGVDRGFEAVSAMDSTSDVYFPIEGENQEMDPFVIQTVPYDIYKQIPYTIELESQTRVVVRAIDEVKFEGSAYLYDNVQDTYQEITSERTAALDLPAGTYEDRFFISFVNLQRTQQVAIENVKAQVLEDVGLFQNNPSQQLEVRNPEGYDIASANIFGMSGKLVYTASNLGNNNKFTFPTGNLSDGIYLVMLTTADNITVNYKITVKNK